MIVIHPIMGVSLSPPILIYTTSQQFYVFSFFFIYVSRNKRSFHTKSTIKQAQVYMFHTTASYYTLVLYMI